MNGIREAFERARTDAGEIDRALAVVEAALAASPGDPVATAYAGSLHAMKAGAAGLPWVKLLHARTATSRLDGAYERRFDGPAEAGLEILLLRGIAYASFPAFLGRAEAAADSLAEAVGHPSFAGIAAPYRALAYAHLARLWHDRNEGLGRRYHEQALRADRATADQVWQSR